MGKIVFQKSSKEFMKDFLKFIGKYRIGCFFCGDSITEESVGLIHKDYVCCNSVLCLTQVIDLIEKKELV